MKQFNISSRGGGYFRCSDTANRVESRKLCRSWRGNALHLAPHKGICRYMKKKILISALVLVALIGVGTGAYLFYEYNDHKPLILKCTVSESPTNSDRVGASYFWKVTADVYGWSVGPDETSAVYHWDAAEERWDSFIGVGASDYFEADKNRFAWVDERTPGYKLKMEIDRNSGGFSVMGWYRLDGGEELVQGGMGLAGCGASPRPACVLIERGHCVRSVEPAKTLKQKF